MFLNLRNYFECRECEHYSLLANTFPGFSQKSLEKWPVVVCLYLRESCERKLINQKKDENFTLLSAKEFGKFKRFGVKWLCTYKFNFL
jgi:hypothetical protein